MRLRFVLLLLLLASLLALITLLPRNPGVLGWLWNGAGNFAAGHGYVLGADSLRGNALAGVTITGLNVTGPGLDVSAASADLRYGLFSLLFGRPSIALDLSGVRGNVDPAAFDTGGPGGPAGGPALPVNIQRLTLDDIELTINEYELYLPQVSLEELAVVTGADGIELAGSLSTPDGHASFNGLWQPREGLLDLDIPQADVAIARHWWDGASSGNVSGRLQAGPDGIDLDARITDATVDYLDVQVTGVAGPVTMHDQVVRGELLGTGLGGSVRAEVLVDIDAENYRGTLTGDARLEEAVPWLGRTLNLDLTGIPAGGPMDLHVLMTGWKESMVTGQANGTGQLAGLPLAALHGTFGYQRATGVSVDANALWSGGDLSLQLLPHGPGISELAVRLTGIQPFLALDSLKLDAAGTVHFDRISEIPTPSDLEASLYGELFDTPLTLDLDAASSDTFTWTAGLSGTGLAASFGGSASLDFDAGTVSGAITAPAIRFPGLPWPVAATVDMAPARFELPLKVVATASSGPLSLGPTPMLVAPPSGPIFAANDGSITLDRSDAGQHLDLAGPALQLALPGSNGIETDIRGSISFAQGRVLPRLTAALAGLDVELVAGPDGDLSGTLAGDGQQLEFTALPDLAGWTLQGELPVSELGDLLGLSLGGGLGGSLSGSRAGNIDADLAGHLELAGLQVDVELMDRAGGLDLSATTGALGNDWRLDGTVWPALQLTAQSSAGRIALQDGVFTGAGEFELPGGLRLAGHELLPWSVNGNLEQSTLNLEAGQASSLRLDWPEGFALTGTIDEQLGLAALPDLAADLHLQLDEAGAIAGHLGFPSGDLQVQGNLNAQSLGLAGSLAAADLLPVLADRLAVSAGFDWSAAPELSGTADWLGLGLQFGWDRDAGLGARLAADGLSGGLADNHLRLELDAFDPLPYLGANLPLERLPLSGSLQGPLGGGLQLDLTSQAGPVNLTASGTPADGISLRADLAEGLVSADGRLTIGDAGPELTAGIASEQFEAQGLFALPPQQLSLSYTAGVLTLSGPGTDLAYANSALSGTANLDLTVLDANHRLALRPGPHGSIEVGLSGKLLNGQISVTNGADVALQLNGTPPAPFDFLDAASLLGRIEGDGNWTARLQASAASPTPLSIGAELQGNLQAFTGTGNVRAGPESLRLLTVQASGDESGIALSSDLASLDLTGLLASMGTEGTVDADGQAVLTLAPGAAPTWQVTGSLQGELASQPLNLVVEAGDAGLTVTGEAAGRPLQATLDREGLLADWAEFNLLVTEHGGQLGTPWFDERLPLTLETVDGLKLTTRLYGLELTAAWLASGPELALQGTPDGSDLAVNMSWGMERGFAGGVDGTLQLPGLGAMHLRLASTVDGNLSVALDGAGPVTARLEATVGREPWLDNSLGGSISASLNVLELLGTQAAHSPGVNFSGRITGSLFDPQASGSVVTLGEFNATGRLNASLDGADLSMHGDHLQLEATAGLDAWQAELILDGQVLERLDDLLPGSALSLHASATGDWTMAGTAGTVDRLALDHPGSSATGSARLEAGRLDAQLDLALPLAGLAAGGALNGDASGSLRLSGLYLNDPGSGRLDGRIDLDQVGIAGQGDLHGAITVTGTVSDPSLGVRLEDGSDQDQALALDMQPGSGRFQLSSGLQFGPVGTDIRVLSSPISGQIASGSLSLPGGGFSLSDTTTGEFMLQGSGDFDGWLAVFNPRAATLSLTGDLAGLADSVTGQLQLLARAGPSGLEFSGGMTGLNLLGTALGDIRIGTVTTGNRAVSLTGSNLQGSISLAGEWQLDRLALEPLPDVSLVASAAGNLTGGNLNAALSGRLLGSPAMGTVSAALAADGISVVADFTALGGRAALDARYIRSAWQGTVELADLSYSGIALAGSGTVWGPLNSPSLELQTEATLLGLNGSGSIHLGPDRLELYQTLNGGDLGGPVVLQGSLAPRAQLRITGPDGNSFRLEQANGDSVRPVLERQLVSSGNASLAGTSAAVTLRAGADGESAQIGIALPLAGGLAVRGSMQLSSLRAFLEQLEDGIELSGRQDTFGTLVLNPLAGRMSLTDFGLDSPLGRITLSGEMGLAGDSRLSGSFLPAPGVILDLPPLAAGEDVPFALLSSTGLIRLVSSSAIGDIEADYRLDGSSGSLSARLRSGGGTLQLTAAWSPVHGLSGQLDAGAFVLFDPPTGAAGILDASVAMTDGRIRGDAQLRLGSGRFSAGGDWGLADLLPPGLAVRRQTGGNLELRVGSLELSELPFIARWAPALAGGVTAVVQVRDNVVAGNLVASGLNAAGSPLPVEALISGSPASLEIGATLAGSTLSLTLEQGVLGGLLELRRFPLHTLAEALAGPLDATAEVTGVARFSLPLSDFSQSEFRLATEQVSFERSGVVTSGNVSLELSSGVLEVSQASFSGAGSWEAGGVLRADELDFRLQALDADFGPMLGLIPSLNQLGVEAAGTVTLEASGSLAEPVVTLDSEALDFAVAGIPYRLENLLVALRSSQLTMAAELLARDTIQGSMSLSGSGGLSLAPLAFQDARFEFGGSLVLPFVGALEDIHGAVYSADETLGAPLLTAIDARLGNTVSVAGSLAPLDLDVTGTDLQLDLPSIFLMGTRLNADLNLRQSDGFDLSGNVTILESQLTLNRGETGGGASLGGSVGDDFRFDSLVIDAPARLRLAESFGTAELAGSLVVTGSLAEPVLTGRAEALRGTFQFGGRDFVLQEAVALFDVTRGLFPELNLTATTDIDRNRLLPAGSSLQLVAPADGQVTVTLSFRGTIEPDPEAGVRLNLEPLLSSNALVQAPGPDGASGVTRPLTEEELLALITLGRTEFASIGGQTGLAPTVAQGALETAVDLLIMSELQRALSEALGLDLVEIRSGALSNLLTGQAEPDQQFGISLRFGGYVSDDVFATYRVSAFDDPEGIYAFSNELGIRYALGPVILDLSGSLNLPDAPDRNAMAQLNLSLLYEINPVTSLEAGFELSSDEQLYRFGVTWRW